MAEASPRTPASNLAEFSVSEISGLIKSTLESRFDRVRVRGEVGRANYHGSGHLYFTLKDADAAMDAVAWRSTVRRLSLRIEEGMEVVCTGRISSWARSSRYQIVVDAVELAGEGALLKLYEDRRRRLREEGLFDVKSEEDLPFLPAVIGIVTSPTGAVLQDIRHRLADRFPTRVLVWPARVQGNGAAEEIAAAIGGFDAIPEGGEVPRPDLVIVARGGGSLEDLWQFNEEAVVRAAAACRIPLISAIGHETDTTLIDFAANWRAPTPTAAAERAVPVRAELELRVSELGGRLAAAGARLVRERRVQIDGLGRGLRYPERLFEAAMQSLDHADRRLAAAATRTLDDGRTRLSALAAALRDPRHLLDRAVQRIVEGERRLHAAVAVAARERAAGLAALSAEPRLAGALRGVLATAEARLSAADALLSSLSHERVLERGFALVRDTAGGPVTRAAALRPGETVAIEFADGAAAARIAGAAGGSGKARPHGKAPSRQASLF